MLEKVLSFSIQNAVLVVLVAILLVAYAAYQIPQVPVDVFPELNAPTVVIMSEAGGLAPDEVEQFVSFPIESAVNGTPGVRRVRSVSSLGLSIVWVEFDWGEDIYRARQLVGERLATVREELPESVHAEITPVTSITGEIMLLSITCPEGNVSPLEMRAFAEFDLRNRLLSVQGVSQVVAIGGELPEYQINVRQDRLRLYNLTIEDVVKAAEETHTIESAGYLYNVEGRELPLRQTGRVRTVDDIRQTLIKYEAGAPVTIGEVATVTIAGAPKRGTAAEVTGTGQEARSQSAVVLSVQKSPGTNTLTLARRIDQALDQAESAMPPGLVLNREAFRQDEFIQIAIDHVTVVLRDAALIVALVLILFLWNLRPTIITLTAIPLSLGAALLALWLLDLNINVMTMGGLAVAIGALVDDAIIFVENIYRRLQENAQRPAAEQRGHAAVVFAAGREILPSVLFATLVILLVFVPLLLLEGMEGRFFRPLGIAFMISILASLLVALTVTPALCFLLLRGRLRSEQTDGVLVRGLKRLYAPCLRWAMAWPRTVVGIALGGTILSILLASTFGSSFLPEFNEGNYTVLTYAPPGTSLPETDRMAQGLGARLKQIEGVSTVTRRTGRAERDEHAEPVSTSEFNVTVQAGADRIAIRQAMDDVLGSLPGIVATIGQPIEHRLSHILSGTPAALSIDVYGEDLDVLRRLAQEIEGVLQDIPGTRDIAANREVLIGSVPIQFRPHDLARWGLTPVDAASQVKAAFYGERVATVNDGLRRYDIVVRLAPEDRTAVEQVGSYLLRGHGGATVQLAEVADVGWERTAFNINRENAQRKAVISCNVAEGYNLGHLVASVRKRVDPIVHQAGYRVTYGGQFEAQQSASQTLLLLGGLVVLSILLLLHMSFGSLQAALLVMINLPLAIIGGIVTVFLTGSESLWENSLALLGRGEYNAPVLSIASLVGFITLFGIAVRNGILLVNHYQHLIENEGEDLAGAVFRGSQERLVPILMTALTAVLGLVPLALAAGEPGSELLAPMALVVLGGLTTSTGLNLVVVPAGYRWLFSRTKRKSGNRKPEAG